MKQKLNKVPEDLDGGNDIYPTPNVSSVSNQKPEQENSSQSTSSWKSNNIPKNFHADLHKMIKHSITVVMKEMGW